jgi:hypothetical protein
MDFPPSNFNTGQLTGLELSIHPGQKHPGIDIIYDKNGSKGQ